MKASLAHIYCLRHFHRAQEFPKTWRLEQPMPFYRGQSVGRIGAGTQVKSSFFSVDLLHAELDKAPELVFFCWPLSESTDSLAEGWGELGFMERVSTRTTGNHEL